MKINALPAFADNSSGLMHDGGRTPVLDCGDTQAVLQALEHDRLQLAAILVTHHHLGHSGAAQAPTQATGAALHRPVRERIPVPFTPLMDGDTVTAPGMAWAVIDDGPARSAALRQ
jgi:hydroxyacylglutathione hydrolase